MTMKFVTLTLLCAGVSYGLDLPLSGDNSNSAGSSSSGLLDGALDSVHGILSPVTGLVGVLPALFNVAAGLRNVYAAVSKLTEIINKSGDASAALSSFAYGFGSTKALAVLKLFAVSNSDLAEAIGAITDASVLSLNLLALSGVNDALNEEADAENALSSVFNETIKEIGAPSGVSADLSGAANGLEMAFDAKQSLIQSVKNLQAVSGATFSLSVTVTGVTQGLDDSAVAFAQLAAAIQSKSGDWNGDDFSGVVKGFNDLSQAENDIADAVRGLTELTSITNLSGGL